MMAKTEQITQCGSERLYKTFRNNSQYNLNSINGNILEGFNYLGYVKDDKVVLAVENLDLHSNIGRLHNFISFCAENKIQIENLARAIDVTQTRLREIGNDFSRTYSFLAYLHEQNAGSQG